MRHISHLNGGISASLARHNPWLASEVETLLALRDGDGLEWSAIADEIGHTSEQCQYRYNLVKQSHQLQDDIRHHRGRRTSNSSYVRPALQEDREARLTARLSRDERAAQTGDVTGIIFGDPPPGYSALDRRAQP